MPIDSVVSERTTKRYHNRLNLSLNDQAQRHHSQGARRKTAQAGVYAGLSVPLTPSALPSLLQIPVSDQRVHGHRRV